MTRLEKMAAARPTGILLREKDLEAEEYKDLAEKVIEICNKYETTCILHSFWRVAKELDCKSLHLPLPLLRSLSAKEKAAFTTLGASCHSLEEAKEAEKLGCTYIIAGHIYETDCKKGLPARGVDFLEAMCKRISIPVYAIGGIHKENIGEVTQAGAKGVCAMSGIMLCESPEEYLAELCNGNVTEKFDGMMQWEGLGEHLVK